MVHGEGGGAMLAKLFEQPLLLNIAFGEIQ